MGAAQFLVQVLNSLAYAMLLFLLAAGISLIFGLMDFMNLSHGSFYLLGGYLTYTLTTRLGSFWSALAVAPLLVAGFALLLERFLIRRLYHRGHLLQSLLTFGFVFIVGDLSRVVWGADVLSVQPPPALAGSVAILGQPYPVYRLFVIAFGGALALALWLLFQRTRLGAILRAGVADRPMASALGINIQLVFAAVFALGAGLAALAGVVAQPVLAAYPGADFDVLLLTLIVVVVGGLGNLTGAFWAALLIGTAETFGKALFPRAAMVVIFALMAAVLAVRPAGLFGRGSER